MLSTGSIFAFNAYTIYAKSSASPASNGIIALKFPNPCPVRNFEIPITSREKVEDNNRVPMTSNGWFLFTGSSLSRYFTAKITAAMQIGMLI